MDRRAWRARATRRRSSLLFPSLDLVLHRLCLGRVVLHLLFLRQRALHGTVASLRWPNLSLSLLIMCGVHLVVVIIFFLALRLLVDDALLGLVGAPTCRDGLQQAAASAQ